MINLSISPLCPKSLCNQSLKKAISQILDSLSINDDISVVIEDDAFIKKYNSNYRGIDSPTDVLSFGSDEIDPETHNRYLGDVIISFEKVLSQAISHNVSEKCELLLLITHGILHLLGYDHDTAINKDKMWLQQSKILESFGCYNNGEQ